MADHPPLSRNWALAILVIAQFAGVSLWFVPNALIVDRGMPEGGSFSIGWMMAMVQIGFIAGTLCYAIFGWTDRLSPSVVFFISASLAALANLGLLWSLDSPARMMGFRVVTGFFIAGIYPVGMKIASDYFGQQSGKALGFLLGALVLGTAFPHMLAGKELELTPGQVIRMTSCTAFAGGCLVLGLVRDGPFRIAGTGFHPSVLWGMFKDRSFRASAFGYFGHMWELYSFWMLLPALVASLHPASAVMDVAVINTQVFCLIAIGAVACVAGGLISIRFGSRQVALLALTTSGVCCLLSPSLWIFPPWLQGLYLAVWGMAVITDSPQFASLVATHAPARQKGSALTIVNSIGFSITVCSIATVTFLLSISDLQWLFLFLLPGPVFGVLAMRRGDTDPPATSG